MIAIVVIVSCLIASGVCKVLKMNMKTVRRGAAADEYVTGEGLTLKSMTEREVRIGGRIDGVEFLR